MPTVSGAVVSDKIPYDIECAQAKFRWYRGVTLRPSNKDGRVLLYLKGFYD